MRDSAVRLTAAPALAALAAYVAAVVWLTWPLAAHLATHLPDTGLPCRFDLPAIVWALAWETHALATDPSRLLDANFYHPTPAALFYGPTEFGALPLFAPVYLATGSPSASANVLLLGGIALSAWAIHLLVVRWTGSHTAGLVAGVVVLSARYLTYSFVPTGANYAVVFWFPLVMGLAAATVPSWRIVLGLALAIAAQALVDPVYVAPAVLAPVAALAGVRLLRASTRRAGWRLVSTLGGALVLIAPVYAGYAAIYAREPHLTEQTHAPHALRLPIVSAPLVSWVFGFGAPTDVPSVVLAVIVIGLAVLVLHRREAVARRRYWAHAALWASVGIFISLPQEVTVAGMALPLPQRWLADRTPLFTIIRAPTRLAVPGLMGLAALAGLAAAEVWRILPTRTGRALEALLVTAFAALAMLGLTRGVDPLFVHAPLPAAYPIRLAAIPDDPLLEHLPVDGGPVLELPMEPLSYQLVSANAMYRSIGRWYPLINGYTSYWPAGFTRRRELAQRLPDAAALAELRADTGVATIVVHSEWDTPEREAWLALARTGGRDGLRFVTRIRNALVFRVEHPAPGDAPVPR